jgi:magnesium transporter
VNLGTAFLASLVVALFDDVIAQITVLATFMPIVAGQGGNSGAQALAVTLRSLALGEIDPKEPRRVLVKEATVGLVNGIMMGLLAGAIATVITGKPALGIVIFLAMITNLIAAGISGAGIPILMQRFGQDPAQSSNILLTTVTDCIGYAAFLGMAAVAAVWLV